MSEPIKCGVAFCPPNWVDLDAAVYAEALGFDALWIGGEFPKDFEAVGVPLGERGRRADEALAVLADHDAEAQRVLAARLQQVYQQPFARLVEKYWTAGTPATCRASLQAYVDADGRTFILTPPVTSADEFRQQLTGYVGETVPALRA